MIIVIDGPSGTGKSTVAKAVARKLGIAFFDTGAMYRSFAWYVSNTGIDPSDEKAVERLLASFEYEIQIHAGEIPQYFVGKMDVTKAIREPKIASIASQVAAYLNVRKALVLIQKRFGHRCSAVFEGRDMGTVVFPDADLKIFLTADAKVRAERRFKELVTKFPDFAETLAFDQILNELEARDLADQNRVISPLRQAADAILIDTSTLSVDQVTSRILQLAKKKKVYPRKKLSYAIVYWIARLFFKFFFRLKIYGLEHFKPGAGIIAANHVSNFDPPVLSISCPEEVHFLAKKSLFQVPFLGFLIRILNSHPVCKGAGDAKVFKDLLHLLKEKKKIIFFPEGARSSNGAFQPLQQGLGFIAVKSRAPIFPAYIAGTLDAWPVKRKFPHLFGQITVVFGAPIEPSDLPEDLDEKEAGRILSEQVAASWRSLKEWFEGTKK